MGEYDRNTRAALDKARREARDRKLAGLSGQDKALALDVIGSMGTNISKVTAGFYKTGSGSLSQWFRGRELVKFFVPEGLTESFLYIVDKLNQFPFSAGWNRRTVRTASYGPCARQAFSILTAYDNLGYCKVSVEDYIYGRMDPETLDYARNSWGFGGFDRNFSYIYAAEIDRGNQKVIDALKDLILSENNTAYLNREMILGIIRSDSGELHKLLGDLLLAARLQEGLRQSICEAMDEGTREAFLTLFKVIEDNNLIRYSSVKRSISTWIGIFDENHVDRVTDKLLTLMGQCLRDKGFCRKLLAGNDSVEISAALWALGFDEAEEAVEAMMKLIDFGTKNQKLTASYYNQNLFDGQIRKKAAKKVLLEYSDDLELVAAFLPAYSSELYGWVRGLLKRDSNGRGEERPVKPVLTDYYDSREEAEALYHRFFSVYERIPKKGLVYDPCIFPWYRVEMTPAHIIRHLAFLAYVLEDQEKITQAAGLLGDMSGSYGRPDLMTLLLYQPRNREQKDILIQAMGIAEESTSKKAVSLVKKMPLEPRDYELMEDMLRFKRSSLRGELLGFLMGQPEKSMEECLKRLLSDKKEEKRSGGLDLLLRLSSKKEKAEFFERVKPLASLVENPSDKEKVLLGEILGNQPPSGAHGKRKLYHLSQINQTVCSGRRRQAKILLLFRKRHNNNMRHMKDHT